MRAATVVQQLCKSCRTCFMFYCKFYFTCDRCFSGGKLVLTPHGSHWQMLILAAAAVSASERWCLTWSHQTYDIRCPLSQSVDCTGKREWGTREVGYEEEGRRHYDNLDVPGTGDVSACSDPKNAKLNTTPPTRLNLTAASRRRCVLGISHQIS